jgi:hypothetical protein
MKILGNCVRCSRLIVREPDWRSLSKDERKVLRATHAGGPSSRGLCHSCWSYLRQIKDGSRPRRNETDDLDNYERKTLSTEIFAEEYLAFKDAGLEDQTIARRLGLFNTKAKYPNDQMYSFTTALKRAREKGLI